MAELKKAAKASRSRASSIPEEALPSREEALAAFSSALVPELDSARLRLSRLAAQAPQLLHVEGGTLEQRVSLAYWWAALLNCDETEYAASEPCLDCAACLRIGAGMFADVIVLDGREGSIKIDQARELRPLLGEAPRFGRKRVILVLEAQSLGIEAANSLLKALEDPCPDSCFIFTMPQRERLLPTLVSRGWVLTLPWPDPASSLPEDVRDWAEALAEFALTGRGWFARSGVKGAFDNVTAQRIVLAGQKALVARLSGQENSELARAFSRLPEELIPAADELFARSQEALQDQVNPALVMDRMASQLFLLVHGRS